MLLIGAVVAVVIGLAGWGVRRLPRALDDPGAAAQYRGIHPRIVEPFSDYSCKISSRCKTRVRPRSVN